MSGVYSIYKIEKDFRVIESIWEYFCSVYQNRRCIMRKSLISLWLMIACIAIISGCKKEEGPIMPLKVGNTWKYVHTFYDKLDTVVSRISEVKGDEYLMGNGSSIFNCWSLKHDGLYAGLNYARINLVPLPLEKGRKWNNRYGEEIEIVGREKIRTKAGRFNCWRIHYQRGAPSSTFWFAPGVGLVKALDDYHEWELLSYSLK